MAIARIRTQFPEEVVDLYEALLEAGYTTVETIRLDEFRIVPADLELTVEKLPVVEAWRRLPAVETVYVAPGTPESSDIPRTVGEEISREPLLARLLVDFGERCIDGTRWVKLQGRECRSRFHAIRERWTPPREYHAKVHLEPVAPSSMDSASDPKEPRIDIAIEHALLQQEALRRKQEAEQRELEERARVAEESRRRAREVAEARALLEEQQKIEAMVRASEALRERVVTANLLPAPHPVERRRPRHVLRTRRDRAFFRAGITALALAFALAGLAAEAFHPRAVSAVLPQTSGVASTVPFAKPAQPVAEVLPESTNEPVKPPSAVPSFAKAAAVSVPLTVPETTASLKPAASKRATLRRPESDVIADDEVIVRKPTVSRSHAAKAKPSIVHYSDLD